MERLYEELRRLRRKAGNVSYGDIAKANARGLSKTTVAAIFTGQGRVGPPRWESIACVFDVLCAELGNTGVAVGCLGTKQDLYELYVEAVDALETEAAALNPAPAPALAPKPELSSSLQEEVFPAAAVDLLPGSAVTIPPLSVSSIADACASPIPALRRAPVTALDTLPRPAGSDDKAAGRPWPAIEDIPERPVPDVGLSALAMPTCPVLPGRLSEAAQPVEKEATFAVLGASSRRQTTADRMRSQFGPCGLLLLREAENGHALAAFMLGVLLINGDAPQEGCLFLKRAAGTNATLALTLPDLAVRDRLCGAIVADICRHVADAYSISGMQAKADRWNTYIDTIDTTFPLAALLYRRTQPVGRHARNVSHDLVHLEDSEMTQISKVYWPDPAVGAVRKTALAGAAIPAPYPSARPAQASRWKPFWGRGSRDHEDAFWEEITTRGIKTKRRRSRAPSG
ncbi:hypothetical protein ABZ897_60035 [Nonomuraea sp. NPDC046802]|uniref:hypothetical protein n=1 Tax=Nonomuraea sp. NPDC046802 TaxID=3154919 RepID=UPI0033D9A339